MKGVIWGIASEAHIADLSHLITPQNIPEAALVLSRAVPYFPDETIHVVVVDPGVGTSRRPMAAQIGRQFYVGPDNGTITLWLESAESQGLACKFIHLEYQQYWLSIVSTVFHGRDIFAPVAGYLAAGLPLESLGSSIDDPVRLSLPRPERAAHGWRGQIIHIDHFGNLASNILREHLEQSRHVTVRLRGVNIEDLMLTFGDRPPGELIALFGSSGNLIVAEVNGSAARRLDARVGDGIDVFIE